MIIYYQHTKRENRMSLPAKIKQLREDREWSQTQLAMKSGLPRSYIGAIENGRVQSPGADKIVKLSKAFGINEDILYQAAGIKPPNRDGEEKEPRLLIYLSQDPTLDPIEKRIVMDIVRQAYERHKADHEGFLKTTKGPVGKTYSEPPAKGSGD